MCHVRQIVDFEQLPTSKEGKMNQFCGQKLLEVLTHVLSIMVCFYDNFGDIDLFFEGYRK